MTSRRDLMIAAITAQEVDRMEEEVKDRDHQLEDSTSMAKEATNVILTTIDEAAATIEVGAGTITEGVVENAVKVGTIITTMGVFRVGEGGISP